MKKLIKVAFLAIAFLAFNAGSVFAQKYGHLNSGNLIAQLPETAAADAALRSYQEVLIKKGEDMAKAFETEYVAFMNKYQEGTITPAVAQAKEKEFQQKQQEILSYEQKVVNDMTKKREELYSPILEKVQKAIDEVGAEGNYAMIFDTSVIANNPIVYAADADDLMPVLKSKLGL